MQELCKLGNKIAKILKQLMLSGFLENIFGGRRKYEGNIETLKASSWLSICSVGSVLQSKCSQTVVLGNFLLFASFKMLPCPAPGCRV